MRTVKLWHLHDDGRKRFAGSIEAFDERELVLKWLLFLATAERGVYFANYRGSFVSPESALECDAGDLALASRLSAASCFRLEPEALLVLEAPPTPPCDSKATPSSAWFGYS